MTGEFTVLGKDEVAKQYPGAVEQLAAQRSPLWTPATNTEWVKVSVVAPGGWQFGVKENRLYLFNSVFHGMKLSEEHTYKSTYVWDGKEWKAGNL